jgi:flagellar basal body rod protein FlgG
MHVNPAAASAASGMHDAQQRLDLAAHDLANASTELHQPPQPDAALGAPVKLDLTSEIAAAITAPIAYAANARVIRADDAMRGTLVNVRR